MFISVFGPCRGCTLRPAGPPECCAFAARLNAAHFKLLQQDTSGQAQTGLLRFLCGLAGRLPPLPRRRRRGSRRARRRRRRHGLDIIRRMLPGSAFGVDLVEGASVSISSTAPSVSRLRCRKRLRCRSPSVSICGPPCHRPSRSNPPGNRGVLFEKQQGSIGRVLHKSSPGFEVHIVM